MQEVETRVATVVGRVKAADVERMKERWKWKQLFASISLIATVDQMAVTGVLGL